MFPEFFAQAPTLRLHDPLARFLGTCDDGCLDFTFIDVARLAGHACPTVGAAFLMTRRALQALYGDQLPVRGEIAVALGAAEEQGTTGVTGMVAGYLTGAAGNGGFAGLAGRFSRRQRLQFGQPLASGLLRFRRLDTGDTVEVGADLARLPADPRLPALLAASLKTTVDDPVHAEFRRCWLDRLRCLLLDHADDPATFPVYRAKR